MNPSPKVSILTATHNALPGLKKTVASVASQTTTDYEHIVIDGGSTDGTREWLEEIDGGLIWISEPDKGIADALNKGLDLAQGEWILVLHAEDGFFEVDSLEIAMSSLDTDSDIVSHDVLFTTESGSRLITSRGFSWFTNFKTTIPHQGAFCRRSLFERIGEFDVSYRAGLDYEFFLRGYRSGVMADVAHSILSEMPNTGISSRLDWPSLRARFDEEREIHQKHCVGIGFSFAYGVYWPLYLSYRRVRYWASRFHSASDSLRPG